VGDIAEHCVSAVRQRSTIWRWRWRVSVSWRHSLCRARDRERKWPIVHKCCRYAQARPNRAWAASLCSIYCCLVLFSLFIFIISFFRSETSSEMTKTMLEWVFYLLTLHLVNIAFVNWPLHCSFCHWIQKYMRVLRTLIVVCHFKMLENARF